MAVVFGIALSISILTYREQKIVDNTVKSSQAYWAAEAGIEDALLRLAKGSSWSSPYVLNVGRGKATTTISAVVGGSRNIVAQGDVVGRTRKLQAVYQITAQAISFYYGAQVGDGGMVLGNNARVAGNIYSNGSVTSAKGYISNSIIVARNGNRIEGLEINDNATAHTCKDSTIGKTLTYVSGGSVTNCTAGILINSRPGEIQPKDLPISPEQINQWKSDAASGGVIVGDHTLSGRVEINFGPKKITGNLLVDNNAVLNITGTVWVEGSLRVDNGATIKLDQNGYGSTSGVIVADGKIKIRPNTYLAGSGISGSYLLLLSTNPEVLDIVNPAIDIDNNADAAIFYTNQGLIVLRNRVKAREVTGYKVYLDNNAEIFYESGLQDATFSSGPGGSWTVTDWKEIE